MARRVLPSRLELKRPDGSGSDAPFANVIFTTFLYASPVQINPSCDHTGLLHFHSSTTSGSACLISARSRDSISPRQPPSSLIRSSIKWDADFVSFVCFLRLASGITRLPHARILAGEASSAD